MRLKEKGSELEYNITPHTIRRESSSRCSCHGHNSCIVSVLNNNQVTEFKKKKKKNKALETHSACFVLGSYLFVQMPW